MYNWEFDWEWYEEIVAEFEAYQAECTNTLLDFDFEEEEEHESKYDQQLADIFSC